MKPHQLTIYTTESYEAACITLMKGIAQSLESIAVVHGTDDPLISQVRFRTGKNAVGEYFADAEWMAPE